jgi:hypothetical protein
LSADAAGAAAQIPTPPPIPANPARIAAVMRYLKRVARIDTIPEPSGFYLPHKRAPVNRNLRHGGGSTVPVTFPRRSLPSTAEHHKKESLTVRVFRLYRVRASGTPAEPFPSDKQTAGMGRWTPRSTPPRTSSRPGICLERPLDVHRGGQSLCRSPWYDSRNAREARFPALSERKLTPRATDRRHRRHCGCALRGRPLQVERHASSARRSRIDPALWRNRISLGPRPGRHARRHALPAILTPEPSVRPLIVRLATPLESAGRRQRLDHKEIHQWPTRC